MGGRPRIYFPDLPDLPLPPGHRFPAAKYRMVVEAIRCEGLFAPGCLTPSPLATREDLLTVHAPAYVDSILEGYLDRDAERRLGLPLTDVLRRRSLATVGGTLAAAHEALRYGWSAQLAGGTHHAHRDFGAGFCVFNDAAVTARRLLAEGRVRRVAILDCDVHQGDGTASLLAADPSVLTIDLFGAKNYPARKVPPDVALPLADGTGDRDYLAVLLTALEAVAAFGPDILIYNAGVDPLAEDRLGRLSVSHAGLAERDRGVFAFARSAGLPVVSVSGGGYAVPIEATVDAYANTLRMLADVFAT